MAHGLTEPEYLRCLFKMHILKPLPLCPKLGSLGLAKSSSSLTTFPGDSCPCKLPQLYLFIYKLAHDKPLS